MLVDQQILRIPGPTPVPPTVERALTKPMIGHRSAGTSAIFQEIRPTLQKIFGTKEEVAVIASSGTGAMETAFLNAIHPDDDVLVVVTGAFGERFANICETYEKNVHRLEVPWGEAANPAKIKAYVEQHPTIRAVFLTICETSTGVLNPIEDIAKAVKEASDALVIVDGVSSIGGAEFKLDDWAVDIAVTGSQKAFMLPGGLSFVAATASAWERIEANPRPCFYFDLVKYRKALGEDTTPFTPASGLLFGLQESLRLIEQEGLTNIYKRHQLMMKMTRAALKAMDLPLLAEDAVASPTVTAVKPTTFDAKAFRQLLEQEFNLIVAGGQAHLTDTIFRIGHMGYCSPADVLQTIAVLEIACKKIGHDFEVGAGTKAAQEVYLTEV